MTLDASIIIPSFNRPRELAECLRSVESLEYPKERFEVIVVDDGSAEPAARAVSGTRGRLRVACLRQENQGPAAARNAGARAAAGRFLCFTDDDCTPGPGWLAALVRALEGRPGALAGGRTVNALAGEACPSASQWIQDYVYAYYNRDPLRARFFASNNLAVEKDAFCALGGFDPAFRTSEDRDLCDRWQRSGRPLIYVPEAEVRHAHRMSLWGFWRQHVGYGRGARRYLITRPKPRIEGGFYAELLRQLPLVRPWRTVLLLGLWQAANLYGFALEALRARKRGAAA